MSELPTQTNELASRWQNYEIFSKVATERRTFFEIKCCVRQHYATKLTQPILLVYENVIVCVVTYVIVYTG